MTFIDPSIMKIWALTIMSFLSGGIPCFGQIKSDKAEIIWGKEQPASKRSTLSDIIGFDDSGIYALKTRVKIVGKPSITLEHYDQQMNQTKSVEIELGSKKQQAQFEFVVHLNEQLYLFTSIREQNSKQAVLYVQQVNKKTLRPGQEKRKIATVSYSGKHVMGNFDYDLSRNASKILIYYNVPFELREDEQFVMNVLDQDLNLLWAEETTLPYKDKLFDVVDFKVDDNGNAHLLGLIYNDSRNQRKPGSYKYQIMSFYENSGPFNEYPINIKGKFLTDMKIAVNDNQDIICAGFYSNEGTSSIIGSYFLKISSQSKEVTSESFKEFGIDFITQNMTRSKEKKTKRKAEKGKETELYEYDLDDIIIREDGGAILIGEQYFHEFNTVQTVDANGNASTRTTNRYNFNDIIVVSILPNGDIDWNEKIPKKQVTVNDGGFYSSYVVSVVGDKLYFVFNDDPRNLVDTRQGKPYRFNNGNLGASMVVLVELDSDGKYTKGALFSSREVDIVTRPLVCEQISENEVILFGQLRKSHRFAKVTFK